jgi:cellobiose-specific phosphotransferase system component IIB
MVIYVCCAGGGTSSLFCNYIKKAAKEDKIYVDDILSVVKKFWVGELNEYNIILCYGPAEKVNKIFIEEMKFKGMIDLVYVAPQAGYLVSKIKKELEPYGIPCEKIDMITFGRMNGAKALEDIKKLVKKF